MSHFTTVATEIRDQVALVRALQALGCKVELKALIQDWYRMHAYGGGKERVCDVVARGAIHGLGQMYDMGFARRADGLYEIVADYEGSSDAREFTKRVLQRYAVEKMRIAAAEKGYRVVGEQKAKDGSIMLMLEV